MAAQVFSRPGRRSVAYVAAAFALSTLLLCVLIAPLRESTVSILTRPWVTDVGTPESGAQAARPEVADRPWVPDAASQRKLHMLLPATQSNIELCKLLLTAVILGYPNPTILAWGEEPHNEDLPRGGGSHFAKITNALGYVNDEKRRQDPAFEDELVFVLDAYDIWFQLPADVLLSRYEAIVREENARVERRMGRAYKNEGIQSTIVFGGGKRCAPNGIHTVSCYPIPDSPLPHDLYNGSTDSVLGRSIFSSFRTRYLNSGYFIGPVRHMRPLLERATEKLNECVGRKGASFDDGSGYSDHCYGGSDQSIFAEMFGEQEFHREVMRRHHRRNIDMGSDFGAPPPPTQIFGIPIVDYLKPDFNHQVVDDTYLKGKPFEFGIAVDYWSDLGHQTSNAEFDARYIRHDQPLEPQIIDQNLFDCPAKAPMPADLPTGVIDLLKDQEPNHWDTLPLYSEICVGRVPVMIHHNSVEKFRRDTEWPKPWWQGRSKALLEEQRKRGAPQLRDGIPSDKGEILSWEQLCPADLDGPLFHPEPA